MKPVLNAIIFIIVGIMLLGTIIFVVNIVKEKINATNQQAYQTGLQIGALQLAQLQVKNQVIFYPQNETALNYTTWKNLCVGVKNG